MMRMLTLKSLIPEGGSRQKPQTIFSRRITPANLMEPALDLRLCKRSSVITAGKSRSPAKQAEAQHLSSSCREMPRSFTLRKRRERRENIVAQSQLADR